MPKAICSIEGCEKPVVGWGWCSLHYQRWKAHGDPLAGRALEGTSRDYATIHDWIARHFPRSDRCEHCGQTEKPTEYASIGHTYTYQREDYLELCRSCHRHFDRKPHCAHGHAYDEANTYWWRGERRCRTCGRIHAAAKRAKRRSGQR